MNRSKSEEIWRAIQRHFITRETWNTPRLKVSDDDLHMNLFPITKQKIYQIIRYKSLKAEDMIANRIRNKGEDFYTAKKKVKHKKYVDGSPNPNPLLIKRRGWGWVEPTFEDLTDDAKKRLGQGKEHYNFADKRNKKIKNMKRIKDVITEENE